MWSNLEIERSPADDAGNVVYHLSGALSYGEPGNRFVAGVKKDLEDGRRSIVLDVSRLERIDSGGIGLLAAAVASARNAGGEIHLTGLNQRYHKLFRAVGLAGIFGIDDKESGRPSA